MSKQTKAIMVLERYGQTDNYVIFYPEDGGEFDEEGVRFDMDRETYDDMGEPNEITVTVVPGYRIEDNEPIVLGDVARVAVMAGGDE